MSLFCGLQFKVLIYTYDVKIVVIKVIAKISETKLISGTRLELVTCKLLLRKVQYFKHCLEQ